MKKLNKALEMSVLILILTLTASSAFAEEKKNEKANEKGDEVNVDAIKQKYWAGGQESELSVVQNRTYSKKGKIEIGILGGVVYSDPFLSVNHFGGNMGYHFSEYFGLHFVGWKYFVQPSNALKTFQQQSGATTNTNKPNTYFGVEGTASLLYGKLSLLGKSIIYYDLHALGGVGMTGTETGNYITPSVGIGQRFYSSRAISVRVDYRLQYFSETLIEQQIVTKLGQPVGNRDNFSNNISLGVQFLFGGGSK